MTFAADYHSTIAPAGFTDFDHPVGTGPMKVKVFEPGVRVIFERNENYWRDGVVHLDEVETIPIPDMVSRLNALRGGDIHVMEGLDPKLVSRAEKLPDVDVISTPSGSFRLFDMMCDRPPTHNLDVQLAM